MRMVHYFAAMGLLLVPALILTAVSGIWMRGTPMHLSLGLFTAVCAVAMALPDAVNGNDPTRTSSPWAARASGSVMPTQATWGWV